MNVVLTQENENEQKQSRPSIKDDNEGETTQMPKEVKTEEKKNVHSNSKNNIRERLPKFNMGNICIPITSRMETCHIGPRIALQGPVSITGVSKVNIVQNENCICGNEKKKRDKPRNKYTFSRTTKVKLSIVNNLSTRRCIIIGIISMIIELCFIYLHYLDFTNSSVKRPDCIHKWGTNDTSDNFTITKWHTTVTRPNDSGTYFVPRQVAPLDDDCNINCDVTVKTRVLFLMPSLLVCSRPIPCKLFLGNSYKHNRYSLNDPKNESNFRDIYYNYFVSLEGIIFEARPFQCPFDEKFLPDYYLNTITIAVPFCMPGNSTENKFYNGYAVTAIRKLLNNLQNIGILNDHPVLHFPTLCKNTLFFNGMSSNYEFSYYIKDPYLITENIPLMIGKLLFLSSDPVAESAFYITSLRFKLYFFVVHPYEKYVWTKSLLAVDKLIVEYTFRTYQVDTCSDIKNWKCPIMAEWGKLIQNKTRPDLNYNYFAFPTGNFVIQGVPPDVSYDVERNEVLLRILIFDNTFFYGFEPDTSFFLNLLARTLEPIVDDIRRKFNFLNKEYRVNCESGGSVLPPMIGSVYSMLTDDYYYVDGSSSRISFTECQKTVYGALKNNTVGMKYW